MSTTKPPALHIGDRVQFCNPRLQAKGTIVEEITRECVAVQWDGLQHSSVHDRAVLSALTLG